MIWYFRIFVFHNLALVEDIYNQKELNFNEKKKKLKLSVAHWWFPFQYQCIVSLLQIIYGKMFYLENKNQTYVIHFVPTSNWSECY